MFAGEIEKKVEVTRAHSCSGRSDNENGGLAMGPVGEHVPLAGVGLTAFLEKLLFRRSCLPLPQA